MRQCTGTAAWYPSGIVPSSFLINHHHPNANADPTTSNNNTGDMNTRELNPSASSHLQVVGIGAGLHTLEAVAASDDAFPPLKLAVLEALEIIRIVKVRSPMVSTTSF